MSGGERKKPAFTIKSLLEKDIPSVSPAAAASDDPPTPAATPQQTQVKAQVASDSKWTSSPYKGFVAGSPSSTYVDVVSTAFEDATNTMNFARHSKFDEMYTPYLGSFRERHNYTSIAPSLCINQPMTLQLFRLPESVYINIINTMDPCEQ
uniref:F-box domain-containing protein n=1 Tax=Caenorhabditis tropicalis TaxID=1561998 RepID=A0A1I7TQY2_9PELO